MLINFLRTWQLGVKSLLLHPMRSLLTILGIFIGVSSVIWLLAIGEGISVQARRQIEGLGADNVIVRTVEPPNEVMNQESSRGAMPHGLTRDDFERLAATLPMVKQMVPVREIRQRFRYLGRMVDGRLVGCTPAYAEMTQLFVDRGRFITQADEKMEANHCVLAAGTAAKLFPFENPVGQAILIEEDYYVVVGVIKPRMPTSGIGGSFSGQDFDRDVYIPIHTLWSRIGDTIITRRSGSFSGEIVELNQITLQIDDVQNVMEASDLIRDMIQRHHTMKDFGITIPLELLEQAKTTRMMFILFMGLIAAISLLVGGIGIMNIMLATVTERTREIGIRRALGAKRRDVIRQFLIETVSLSIVGGLTGVLAGLTCGPFTSLLRKGLQRAIPEVMTQLPPVIQNVQPEIVPMSIPLAFGISVTIGILFGIYPAMRAAAMDPIEALRHE